MKEKIFIFILVAFGMAALADAMAATFSPENCLNVSVDEKGIISVSGNAADVEKIKKLIQFCPDKYKGGCSDNRIIPPASSITGVKKFQINLESAKVGQRAFNFKSGALWLHIPNPLVEVGNGLILEMSQPNPESEDGRGGAHFVISAGYEPLYPLSAGGESCIKTIDVGISPKPSPSAVREIIPAGQVMGGGDSRAVVKGDGNDVIPQTIKQQARQKTTVKGNNNTVKKNINQIGVNAKTTGANSPVTVHINGIPSASDETCMKCHQNVIIKKDPAVKGNVPEQQKKEEKKEVKK